MFDFTFHYVAHTHTHTNDRRGLTHLSVYMRFIHAIRTFGNAVLPFTDVNNERDVNFPLHIVTNLFIKAFFAHSK